MYKLPMPAQKRLRRHHQSVAPARWQQTGERCEQRTIGWSQPRATLLPTEHDQLMTQHE
jgi:hypothetical protein